MSSELKALLDQASTGASRPADAAALWATARKRKRRSRMAASAGLMLVVLLASSVFAGVNEGQPNERQNVSAPGCGRPGIDCFELGQTFGPMATGFGSVWVMNYESQDPGRSGFVRIDEQTGRVEGHVDNLNPEVLATDDRWVWALDEGNRGYFVARIDPRTNEVVAKHHLGHRRNDWVPSIATVAGYAWVAGDDRSVTRIPSDNGDEETFSYANELPDRAPVWGSLPVQLSSGDGKLFLAWGENFLGIVDPHTGEFLRKDEHVWNAHASEVEVDEGEAWTITNGELIYWRYDDPAQEVADYVRLPGYWGIPTAKFALGTEDVWTITEHDDDDERAGSLARVDRGTYEITQQWEVPIDSTSEIEVGEGYVWVTAPDPAAPKDSYLRILYRIEP